MDSHANVIIIEAETIENLDGLIVRMSLATLANLTPERIEEVLPSWPEIFEGDDIDG